jgi:hypothetical protein
VREANEFHVEWAARKIQRVGMVTILVRLADLEFLSPHDLSGGLSTSEIVDVIRKQFGYLPGEVDVEINDGVANRRLGSGSKTRALKTARTFPTLTSSPRKLSRIWKLHSPNSRPSQRI